MQQYVAFLRGINVGGARLINMAELKTCLSAAGLSEARTYLQSGNILFQSMASEKVALAAVIASAIEQVFGIEAPVALFREEEWRRIIEAAPTWWGAAQDWRHNILIPIQPQDVAGVVSAIGPLKPAIEALQAGDGALYQSIAIRAIGRGATGSKLVSNPVYRQLTIRNFNTATKLAALLS